MLNFILGVITGLLLAIVSGVLLMYFKGLSKEERKEFGEVVDRTKAKIEARWGNENPVILEPIEDNDKQIFDKETQKILKERGR